MANRLLVNLVAAWLNNATSGKRFDAHKFGRDFEVEAGNVTSAVGINGNCCDFSTDEANRLAYVDDGAFEFPGSFSVAAYFNQPGDANNTFLAKHLHPSNESWIFFHRTTNNKIRFEVSSDGTGGSPAIVEPGETTSLGFWHLAAAGLDFENDEIWISLDAGDRVTLAHSTGVFTGAVDLTMGWFTGTSRVMGSHLQDETYCWDRYLSPNEILTLWDDGNRLFFEDFQGPAAEGAQYYHYAGRRP